VKLLGIVLVAAGILALVYKGVDLPGKKEGVKIGSFEATVQKKDHVTLPTWVGVVAIVAGGAMLLSGSRR
jgi:hypothetical protein